MPQSVNRRIFLALFAAPLALPALAAPNAAVPPPKAAPAGPPAVTAKAVMIIDAATGRALFQKNADEPCQVASTQKLMTALLLCEAGNLDRAVTVEAYDAAAEPTKLFIKPGEKYIRRNLLQAMLIKSANDCARCLARSHAGTESSFAVLMNKRAAMLGMRNSVFKNASGLPAEGQHSTARDMSLLARAALNQPVINQFVRLKEAAFTHADGRVKKLENTNHLLVDSPYCHGMKTGYTDAAGRCLVSCGTFRSRTVIVVVLGASAKSIWKESLGLLHWALGVPS